MRSHVLIIEPYTSGLELLAAATRLGHRPLVLSHNAADRVVPPAELDRGGAEVACIRVHKGLCGTDVQEIMKTLVAAAEEIEHWLAERPRTPLEVVR